MSNITLPEAIRNEFTVHRDGSTTTTIRGAARLAGVEPKALRYQFSGGEKSGAKLAQSLMAQDFDPGEFKNGIPEIALATILEYYRLVRKFKCQSVTAFETSRWWLKKKPVGTSFWDLNPLTINN